MKYLMYKVDGVHFPILFPDVLTHANVADRVSTLLVFSRGTLVSAGTVTCDVTAVSGESVSCNVTSDPADLQRIKEML
jgi:hypothetical protein